MASGKVSAKYRAIAIARDNCGTVFTGDNNTVVMLNGCHIPLARLSLNWRLPKNSIQSALSWKTRVAPLIGRDSHLEELLIWAKDSRSRLSIRLLYGAGGSGKTRLAGEVAERLRDEGWAAGHIDVERPTAYFEGESGTLMLVDYPEQCPEVVRQLVDLLGTIEEPDRPLRLLLLSRHGPDYWSGTLQASRARELVDPAIELSNLLDTEPWALFRAAWNPICDLLEMSGVSIPITEDQFYDWLSRDQLNRFPLLILAYIVQLAHEPADWTIKGAEILNSIACREIYRWRVLSESTGMDKMALERLRGLASISNGLRSVQLRELAGDTGLALNLPAQECVVDCIDRTGELEKDVLPAVAPDLLAACVLTKILDGAHDKAGEWLWKALDISESFSSAVEGLGRLAYDTVYVFGGLWPEDALAAAVEGQIDRCVKLAEVLPRFQMAGSLVPLAIAVFKTLLAEERHPIIRARLLFDLSTNLRRAGDIEGSLSSVEQSIAALRLIISSVPGEKVTLAYSLKLHSTCLASLGRKDEAIESIKECVDIFSDIENLSVYIKHALLISLIDLSCRQKDAGHFKDADETIKRAVNLYEDTGPPTLDDYMSNEAEWAHALLFLGVCLGQAYQEEEALSVLVEAASTYSRLASHQPEKYEGVLASALMEQASYSAAVGYRASNPELIKEALRNTEDALDIYERYAARCQNGVSSSVAHCLYHRARMLREAAENEIVPTDYQTALNLIQRSITMFKSLSKDQPGFYDEPLARCLWEESRCWKAVGGNWDSSINSMQECAKVFEQLAQREPRYEHSWDGALRALSRRFKEAGHPEEGEAALQRAEEIRARMNKRIKETGSHL